MRLSAESLVDSHAKSCIHAFMPINHIISREIFTLTYKLSLKEPASPIGLPSNCGWLTENIRVTPDHPGIWGRDNMGMMARIRHSALGQVNAEIILSRPRVLEWSIRYKA
jgi:hypothetical protein